MSILTQKLSVDDTRIREIVPLPAPNEIIEELAADDATRALVLQTRTEIKAILNGEDDRLLVVVGPCSIHDEEAAYDYAQRLVDFAPAVRDDLLIVMRTYFEKPRTTIGWKGLMYDPELDGEMGDINKGIRLVRKILLHINEMGLPTSTEYLDTISPQFIADLVSWGAIGARTVESQIHRQLVSGISCPIGLKNGTNGSIKVAIDAMVSASNPHKFFAVTKDGLASVAETTGNDALHIVLRGGSDGPNYSPTHVADTAAAIEKRGFRPSIMIDSSHGNSYKDHTRQKEALASVCQQVAGGEQSIIGVMIESHIHAGNQKMSDDMAYGVSITDKCIDWQETEVRLTELAEAARMRRSA